MEVCSINGHLDVGLRVAINYIVTKFCVVVWKKGDVLTWKTIDMSAEQRPMTNYPYAGSLFVASWQWIVPWLESSVGLTTTCSCIKGKQTTYSVKRFSQLNYWFLLELDIWIHRCLLMPILVVLVGSNAILTLQLDALHLLFVMHSLHKKWDLHLKILMARVLNKRALRALPLKNLQVEGQLEEQL